MSDKSVTITIGWTKSDMPHYSSYDGYRKGAEQHTETVVFEVPGSFTHEDICWSALDATNMPKEFIAPGSYAESMRAAIEATGYTGEQAHFSLSKGDTVTIEGVQYAFTGYAVEVVQ